MGEEIFNFFFVSRKVEQLSFFSPLEVPNIFAFFFLRSLFQASHNARTKKSNTLLFQAEGGGGREEGGGRGRGGGKIEMFTAAQCVCV